MEFVLNWFFKILEGFLRMPWKIFGILSISDLKNGFFSNYFRIRWDSFVPSPPHTWPGVTLLRNHCSRRFQLKYNDCPRVINRGHDTAGNNNVSMQPNKELAFLKNIKGCK